MTGVPDGTGVYETKGSYYVFANHELATTRELRLQQLEGVHLVMQALSRRRM